MSTVRRRSEQGRSPISSRSPVDGSASGEEPPASPALAGVVVPTHNDGANIGPLLRTLLAEPCVGEVFVVASACDDETVPTVKEIAAADGRVRLHEEEIRSGKAAAVNLGIEHITLAFVVVVSGDVLPHPGAVSRMVDALRRPGVGLAGGRPLPVNSEDTFVGYAVHLLWRLHHRLALEQPKIGEAIAMRREAVRPLPADSSVDEPWFQALLQKDGWIPAYVPDAIIANRGPGTVRDFVKQRRQVHTGNLWLNRRQAYKVPSLRPLLLAAELGRDLFDDRRRLRPMGLAWTAGAVGMEAWARMGARVNYFSGRERHVWDMVQSAKAPALGPDGLGLRHR